APALSWPSPCARGVRVREVCRALGRCSVERPHASGERPSAFRERGPQQFWPSLPPHSLRRPTVGRLPKWRPARGALRNLRLIFSRLSARASPFIQKLSSLPV